jgi:hypothetical protein
MRKACPPPVSGPTATAPPIASMDLSGCKVEALDSSNRLDRRGVERARGATSALPRVSEPRIGSIDEVSNELEARLAPCRA